MAKIDYPAAHSMDTDWFAMDEAGEVACFSSGENGPVPRGTISQSSIYDLLDYLDKDENGTPILSASCEPFPDGPSTVALQQIFDALPEAEREVIRRFTLHPGLPEADLCKQFDAINTEYVRAVVLLTDTASLHEFSEPDDVIRLDPQRPLYYLGSYCVDALCLLVKGRLLAWRKIELEYPYELELTQVHGIYCYDAPFNMTPAYLNKHIPLAAYVPLQYARMATPQQPRVGLPASVLAATLYRKWGKEEAVTAPLVHTLPGVRFASMSAIQLADFIAVYDWGSGDLLPDTNAAIIRKNMAMASQTASSERDARLASWKTAAAQGDWLAQMSLAFACSLGAGMQDSEMAFYWYYQAAQQVENMPSDSADMFENGSAAQCCVADLFERGIGVLQDYPQARHWYLLAAARENYVAQYRLGVMYRYGLGVPRDDAKAQDWLRKAAKHYHSAGEILRIE